MKFWKEPFHLRRRGSKMLTVFLFVISKTFRGDVALSAPYLKTNYRQHLSVQPKAVSNENIIRLSNLFMLYYFPSHLLHTAALCKATGYRGAGCKHCSRRTGDYVQRYFYSHAARFCNVWLWHR